MFLRYWGPVTCLQGTERQLTDISSGVLCCLHPLAPIECSLSLSFGPWVGPKRPRLDWWCLSLSPQLQSGIPELLFTTC